MNDGDFAEPFLRPIDPNALIGAAEPVRWSVLSNSKSRSWRAGTRGFSRRFVDQPINCREARQHFNP
jgi:hypothetical protein